MAKKKQLRNRLDDLFAGMPPDSTDLPAEETAPVSGWTWDCGPDGHYRACSPEVEAILGVSAADFLGQPLVSFLLLPESSRQLRAALEGEGETIEISLRYRANDGSPVTVRADIFRRPEGGWRGFSQVIEAPPQPEPPEAIEPLASVSTPGALKPVETAIGVTFSSAFGLAVEDDGPPVQVSSPYSGAGKMSLQKRQTVSNPSAPGVEAALAVPVPLPEQSLGLLEIIDTDPARDWNDDEQRLVEDVASQLALALENALLFQETQRRAERERVLSEIVAELNAREDPKDALPGIQARLKRVIPVDRLTITLKDPSGQLRMYTSSGASGTLVQAGVALPENSAPAWVVRNKRALVEGQIGARKRRFAEDAILLRDNFASRAVLPLRAGARVLGTLNATSHQPNAFTLPVQAVLRQLASQMTLALERYRLFRESQAHGEELAFLNEMGQQMTSLLDVDAVLEILDRYLPRLVDATNLYVALYDEKLDQITFGIQYHHGSRRGKSARQAGQGLTEYIIRTRKTLFLPDNVQERISHLEGVELIGEIPQSWVGTPMLIGNRTIGVIAIQNYQKPNAYDTHTVEILEAVASQAAVALHNARLYQQAQARSRQLQTAAEVSRAASSILDPNPLITQTVDLIRERFDLYYVGLFLVDSDGRWTREPGKWAVLRAGTGEAGRIQVERGHKLEIGGDSMIGHCISTGEPQISQQVSEEEQRFLNPLLPETRSEMALPLTSRGQVLGAMTIQSAEPAAFSEDDIAILQTMVDQVANALQNASLFDQVQMRAEELQLVNRVVAQVAASLDLNESLQIVIDEVVQLTGAVTGGITVLNPERTAIILMAERIRLAGIPSSVGMELPLDANPLSRQVIESGQPLIVDDPQTNPMLSSIHEHMRQRGIETLMVYPLIVSGEAIGTLGLDFTEKNRRFAERESRLVETIILQTSTAIENARLFDRVETALNETQALYTASAALNAVSSFDDILGVLRTHTLLRDADNNVSINIFDRPWEAEMPEWSFVIARWSQLPPEVLSDRYRLRDFPAAKTLLHRTEATLIENLPDYPDIDEATRHLYVKRFRAGSTIFVPLTIAGQWIGYVNGIFSQPRRFSDAQVRRLTTLVTQATVAIQNIQLLEETRRQLRTLSVLSNASQSFASAPLDVRSVSEIIARIFADLLGGNNVVSVALLDQDSQEQMVTYVSLRRTDDAITVDETPEAWDFRLSDYPATAGVMTNAQPLVVQADDAQADSEELAYMHREGVQTLVILPLIVKGQPIGIIGLEYRQKRVEISEDELSLATTLANQAAIALNNAILYEEQRRTAEQLREIDMLKSQFLANMSHELRTPLNSIIGFSRVIMKGIDGPVTDLQRQDLSAIYNAGQHLLSMINDILDISKIEAGKMELAFDEIDIASIVESVLSTARGLIKEKPVQLLTDIEANLPVIQADPIRVRQILLNLISNAAKFTDEGSITVSIHRRTGAENKPELYIAVTDTGTGIAEKDQDKLFIPFSQVDGSPTRKVGGTGLGLSITRMLVELHGGEIGVISADNRGSTFWFTLPIPEDKPDPAELTPQIVLAIDADPQVISLYARYLGNAGYQVLAVTDPRAALIQAREIMPAVITLDIMMPDFDGWQLLRDLKADPEVGKIPVVICSLLDERAKGLEQGAADYLVKPILEEELVQAIRKVLPPED